MSFAIAVWHNPRAKDDWYLMRDPDDHIVHVYGRRERAEKTAAALQKQNPRMRIEVTDKIGQRALQRAQSKREAIELKRRAQHA